ncbi:hypothetical protein P9112_010478 [Eukaryota sp. TZLM1-RC]
MVDTDTLYKVADNIEEGDLSPSNFTTILGALSTEHSQLLTFVFNLVTSYFQKFPDLAPNVLEKLSPLFESELVSNFPTLLPQFTSPHFIHAHDTLTKVLFVNITKHKALVKQVLQSFITNNEGKHLTPIFSPLTISNPNPNPNSNPKFEEQREDYLLLLLDMAKEGCFNNCSQIDTFHLLKSIQSCLLCPLFESELLAFLTIATYFPYLGANESGVGYHHEHEAPQEERGGLSEMMSLLCVSIKFTINQANSELSDDVISRFPHFLLLSSGFLSQSADITCILDFIGKTILPLLQMPPDQSNLTEQSRLSLWVAFASCLVNIPTDKGKYGSQIGLLIGPCANALSQFLTVSNLGNNKPINLTILEAILVVMFLVCSKSNTKSIESVLGTVNHPLGNWKSLTTQLVSTVDEVEKLLNGYIEQSVVQNGKNIKQLTELIVSFDFQDDFVSKSKLSWLLSIKIKCREADVISRDGGNENPRTRRKKEVDVKKKRKRV